MRLDRRQRAAGALLALAFLVLPSWTGRATAAPAAGAPGRQLAAAALPGVEPAVLRDRGAAAARPNDRRDPRGRPGPAPAGVLAAVVLAGAMLLPPAAVRPAPRRPRRPGRHAPAAPRAPPLLQPA